MVRVMKGSGGKFRPAIGAAIAAWAITLATPAQAAPIAPDTYGGDASAPDPEPYLQCVPYARQVSGIQIRGDAWTWWDQADGLYRRGHVPRVGAVMSFRPYGSMVLGHVAAVSRVIDSRTVLVRHANWSPINGRRGQIEDDVRAVDVSPDNDWSEVRVWFAPLQALGTTRWPLNGFIYPQKLRPGEADRVAPARPPLLQPAPAVFRTGQPDDFTALFARYAGKGTRAGLAPSPKLRTLAASAPVARSRIDASFLAGIAPDKPARRVAKTQPLFAVADDDPIGRIIAARMR